MTILILGGSGMLGHTLYRHFRNKTNTKVTLRQDEQAYTQYHLFRPKECYFKINAMNMIDVVNVIENTEPSVIINAIGRIKHRSDIDDHLKTIELNAAFPHRLSITAKAVGARVIHMSTDCVFDGKKGAYTEDDLSNATDSYGKTKALGELQEKHTVTLRTSIIGPELHHHTSLLDWVLAQSGTIRGFTKAIYTGFTTIEMARIIERVIARPDASGLYQVASNPITKYDLLCLINKHFDLDLDITHYDDFECYRDLVGTRFNSEFDYEPPSWDAMIQEVSEIHVREYELNGVSG